MADSVRSSRAQAPSPTSEAWFIDQVLEELAAHRAGRLNLLCTRIPAERGEFHHTGLLGDEERCAITYVRDSDEAVTPIAAGDFHRALSVYDRRTRSAPDYWDPETSPPPSVILNGSRRYFTPTYGRFLVGIIDAAPRAVLLAAIGTAFAVIHVDHRGEPAVLHLGAPQSLRELDRDRLLPFRRRAHAAEQEPRPAPAVELPGATRLHHLRIVRGVPLAHPGDPPLDEVIAGAFASLACRACQPEKRAPGWRAQGKTKLRDFFELLLRLGHLGSGDIGGRISEIHAFFAATFGEAFRLSKKVLATVLRLLHRAGTCLVRKPSARTWTICLAGLTDPRSALHRALLRETATPYRFLRMPASTASAANSRPAQREAEAGPIADAGTDRDPTASPEAATGPTTTTSPPPTPVECLAGLCLALAAQANARRDTLEVRVREQADALALVTDELKSVKDERERLQAELALRDQAALEALALAETSDARFQEIEARLRESEEVQRLLRAQLASTGLLTTPTSPVLSTPTPVSAPLPDHPTAANEDPAESTTTEADACAGAIDPRPRGPPG